MAASTIVMYGAATCPDSRRSRRFLDGARIPYRWVDIDEDPEGMRAVLRINGHRVTPTILFPDGSVLVEPSNEELGRKVGARTS